MSMHSRSVFRPALLFVLAAAVLAVASAPARANDRTILTVLDDDGAAVEFSMDALDRLPQRDIATGTIWQADTSRFTGPALVDVLDAADVAAEAVELAALNDYSVELPTDTLEDTAPIVATRIDGAPISRRDKGPLWIIYPYDSDPRYRTETIYARSVWHLHRIEVVR